MTDFLGLPRSAGQSFAPHNVNQYPLLAEDLRDRLRAFYRPHNRRLEALTGLSFPWPGSEAVQPTAGVRDTSGSGEFVAA